MIKTVFYLRINLLQEVSLAEEVLDLQIIRFVSISYCGDNMQPVQKKKKKAQQVLELFSDFQP